MVEDNRSIQGYVGGVFWERNSLNDQQRVRNDRNLINQSQNLFEYIKV